MRDKKEKKERYVDKDLYGAEVLCVKVNGIPR